MLAKPKQLLQKVWGWLTYLKDMRTVGLLLFLVVVLMISWSGVRVIETNYLLQRQIAGLQQQNNLQEIENQNTQLQNAYYNTPQYLEIAARGRFGLAAPGETVYNVPRQVALTYTIDPLASHQAPKPEDQPPAYQRNFQAWMDFLFHRRGTSAN